MKTKQRNISSSLLERLWEIAPAALLALAIAGGVVYAHTRISDLTARVEILQIELSSTTAALAARSDLLASNLTESTAKLADNISAAEQKIENTNRGIETVASKVGGVEQKLDQKVGEISGTVSTLEKLTKTDPELLQKYSKVFFLNEHFSPDRVVDIPKKYLYNEQNPEVVHEKVWPYMQKMLDKAGAEGQKLYVQSAYRSHDEQRHLKAAYSVIYGAGTANQFSADQGYSEHQLGTAVDFITSGLGGQLEGFEGTTAYNWMQNNAHKYGFTLSYPQGNAYYIFEPWHWRFVGVSLATYLHDQGKNFYDLDQRTIDEYLVKIFD
jgi:D-alanyl-D-alanine carboxypeptidase